MQTFIFLLYRTLQVLGFPLLILYLLRRILRDVRYRNGLRERFGILPGSVEGTVPGSIWLHAVSVGEVLTAVELAHRLRERFRGVKLYVSVTTLAGRAMADQKLSGLADGVFYAPIDYVFAVRRVLRTIRPSLVLVMETEIWPNLYREAKRRGCALMIVNGRISDKAFPHYRRWAWFFRPVLSLPDLILAQTAAIRERYIEAGAPPERVEAGGNLKYDFDPGKTRTPEVVRSLLEASRPGQVWIAASTMPPETADDPDEDDVVIGAYRELAAKFDRLLLILVPRRPERFDSAAEKLGAAGVRFLRRSNLTVGESLALPGVLLLDSVGELGGTFPLGDVVFMGGSIVHRGGHNILEAAFFSKPVVAGPHMENFADIAEEFTSGGGLVRIASAGELAGTVERLLADEGERARVGARARQLAEAKRGATDRVVTKAAEWLDRRIPVDRGSVLLEPLAWIWRAGAEWRRRRQSAVSETLSCPVISVGGIAMGGIGKSPVVLWLVEALKARGQMPAILTRGYRRRKHEEHTLLGAGEAASAALTGDEAQMYVRAATGPLGIGKNRAATGRLLAERYHPDVVVLDDGFQHWRLCRDLDIVLIDALDPFGGGHVFPRGRLREPLEALERADAFVITRAEQGREYSGIVRRLREYNGTAPVFRARVKPVRWVNADTGEHLETGALSGERVAAFCGLGNPASFFMTLGELGVRIVYRWTFGDHHHYRPTELRRLASQAAGAGAAALVATEKDIANLDEPAREWAGGLPLFWLQIGIEIDDAEGLLNLVPFQRQ